MCGRQFNCQFFENYCRSNYKKIVLTFFRENILFTVVLIKNLKLLCQIHYFIINSPIFIEYLWGLWMIFYGFVLVWKTTTLDQRHNPKKLATIFRVSKQNRGKLWTIRPYIILVILMQQSIIFEFWVETPRFFKMLKTLIISDR